MNRLIVMYCLDCEWDASARGLSRTDLEVLTVEHELVAGHEIASVWIRRDHEYRFQVSNEFWQR